MNNTAVARGKFVDGAAPKVENVQVIFHQAPSLNSPLHFGGRLVFSRDGTLFVTMGDRSITEGRMQAQRMDGLLGKIVRASTRTARSRRTIRSSARTACGPEIWSFGHRNIQAATLNPTTGELWEVEHGTRGGDEVNVVAQGQGLRLADDRVRHRVSGPPDHRRHPAEGGHGAAALLLGSEHRAERHGVLHRQAVPGVAEQPVHRRPGQHEPGAADAQGRTGRRAKSVCCRTCSRHASAIATCDRDPTARSIC